MADKLQELLKKSIFDAEAIVERKRTEISVSPRHDDGMGGGLLGGSLVIMTGPTKCGKTTTALHMAKKAQGEGYTVIYDNIEHRLTERDIRSMSGLCTDKEKFQVIKSTQGNILAGEDHIRIVRHLLETSEKPLFIIMDSVSQLCPRDFMVGDIGERMRDNTPLILSAFSKVSSPILGVSNHIVVCITHQVANTGMTSAYNPKSETGGTKIQYAADFKLRATHAKIITDGDQNPIGQDVFWICEKSCLGGPMIKYESRIKYNHGIDEEYELVSKAIELSIVKKSGAWFSFGEVKKQGEQAFMKYLTDNPTTITEIKEKVRFSLEE